jgi:hypothetical protein
VGQDVILRRVVNPPKFAPIGNRRAGYQPAPQLLRERLGDLFFNLGLRRQADMMRGHPAFTVD